MHVQWPLVVAGGVLLIVAMLLFFFRAIVTRFIIDSNRAMFGRLVSRMAVKGNPRQLAVVALLWALFGVLLVVLGVALPPYHPH